MKSVEAAENFCPGREYFEVFVPFGSDKNKCPFGLEADCRECRFYRE